MANVKLFPLADAALLAWAQNLATRLSASPTVFNVTAAQCTAFTALVALFATNLAACDPGTRSKSLVIAKNQSRADMKAAAKLLASCVSGSATVTDAERVQLGLNVRAKPQPVPPPTDYPMPEVVSVVGNKVTVKLKSSGTPKRGRPPGVTGTSIFSAVGPVAPTTPEGFKFEGSTNKTLVEIDFPLSLAPGTQVWVTAFFYNAKSANGPSCKPLGIFLQGGIVPMGKAA